MQARDLKIRLGPPNSQMRTARIGRTAEDLSHALPLQAENLAMLPGPRPTSPLADRGGAWSQGCIGGLEASPIGFTNTML